MTGAAPAGLPLRLGKRHFGALDLSRLVAAVLVLFWHYQHLFVPAGVFGYHVNRTIQPFYPQLAWAYEHGAAAVEYFWAVSGFVFAHVYLADDGPRGRFWLARVARLWPLHLLTLVVVAGLQGLIALHQGGYFIYRWNDGWHFALQLVMAHYWGFQRDQSFNGPSWSLSTEILAYAAFWLLLPLLRQAGARVAFVTALGLAAGLALVVLQPHPPMREVLECLLYFFGGVALYAALLAQIVPLRAVPALGAALAGLALWLWLGGGSGKLTTLATIAAALVLTVAVDLADRDNRMAFGRALGDASYGIYLWHVPIQLVLVLALPGVAALALQPSFLAFFLGVTCLAGFASHRWIEKPAQRAVLRLAGRLRGGLPAAA